MVLMSYPSSLAHAKIKITYKVTFRELLCFRSSSSPTFFSFSNETFLQAKAINYEKQKLPHLMHILILHKTPSMHTTQMQFSTKHKWQLVRLSAYHGGMLACVGRSKASEEWSFFCATWIRPFSKPEDRQHEKSARLAHYTPLHLPTECTEFLIFCLDQWSKARYWNQTGLVNISTTAVLLATHSR